MNCTVSQGEKHLSGNTPGPEVSVIICTRNRCEILQRTLELLSRQRLPEGRVFEVIVVDNASTDATRQIVEHIRDNVPLDLHYLYESRPGLSRARNTGFARARGWIVVFTDDDIIFPDEWLYNIYEIFQEDPQPACVTGPVEIHQDSHPSLRSSSSIGRKRFRHPVEPWEVGRGNNMAFLKSYLEKAGPFDARLGAGTSTGSGEDTDMFYRVLKLGGEIVFEPSISVYHDHRRHDPEEIKRICRSYAVGGTAFLVKHVARLDIFALKLLYWKYESFRLGLEKAKTMPDYAPSLETIQRIYIRGYFQGLVRGTKNLFQSNR